MTLGERIREMEKAERKAEAAERKAEAAELKARLTEAMASQTECDVMRKVVRKAQAAELAEAASRPHWRVPLQDNGPRRAPQRDCRPSSG